MTLSQTEELFHDLVDAVTDYAIFVLDSEGRVSTWNVGASRIKGYTAAEITGAHVSIFYTAEDRAAGLPWQILERVRREDRVEHEGWRVRKDGTRFWANVIITSLRNSRGELQGFAKVTRDLTERRAAEEQLRQTEERFRLLVESVVDYAIYMLDPEGRVSTWNAGAQRMKGYAAHEIIGLHFSRFFSESDISAGKPRRELEIARELGRFEDEGWRVRKDGTPFWANVALSALRDATGQLIGFAKVTRDLTASRQAELVERELFREQVARNAAEERQRALRKSQEAAEEAARRAEEAARRADEANRIKDEFLATVSHELRTPLNAILGWSAILRSRGVADPSMAKAVDVIHRNAEAQARLVEDILDVSRMITGQLRLDLKLVDAVAIVKEAIEVVRPAAVAKGIAIELVSGGDPALIVGDPERLQQVVWNLLSNAVKFSERGAVTTARVEQDAEKLTISVKDTGRGIDAEFLPYVFDRFKQADGTTTRRYGGLGLGLSIVRHIVELHGGQVDAESQGRGAGALFRVMIPLRTVLTPEPGPVEAIEEPPSSVPPASAALNGVRVLVIDDDADSRELLRWMLGVNGAEVELADSAVAGLQMFRRSRPHVLVCDIGMPEIDGYSLMNRIRAHCPEEGGDVPSIALTAYTRAVDREKALAAGFTMHLAKPVDARELITAIAKLVVPEAK